MKECYVFQNGNVMLSDGVNILDIPIDSVPIMIAKQLENNGLDPLDFKLRFQGYADATFIKTESGYNWRFK